MHRLKGPGDVIGVYFGVTYYADGSAVHADGTCEPQLGYSTAYAHD